MSALTQDRDTIQKAGSDLRKIPMAANVKVFAGGIAVIDAGYVKPGVTGLNLIAVGRFEESVDNTGGAAGAKSALVRGGIFRVDNLAGDLIVQADLGKDCFVTDDQTVSKTNGGSTKSVAGKVWDIDVDGVFVKLSQ